MSEHICQCQVCFKPRQKCTREKLFSKKMPKIMGKDISNLKAFVCDNCKNTLNNIKGA